ncbi:hypothetical protein SteCoe_20719 [Stentor coeruleus]|uniref:RBR-type E3 ubiquitin transferase n=1 Tax=Stentor coeruleus TaxID=5963 RepID=A0A1R2BRH3_9CILI|nr:hypothetical protein SteCoe_20719 [Stentor coeruleus]
MFIIDWLNANCRMKCDFDEEANEIALNHFDIDINDEQIGSPLPKICKIQILDEHGNKISDGKSRTSLQVIENKELKNQFDTFENNKNERDSLKVNYFDGLSKGNSIQKKINSNNIDKPKSSVMIKIKGPVYSSNKIKNPLPLKDKVIIPEENKEETIEDEENLKIFEKEQPEEFSKYKKTQKALLRKQKVSLSLAENGLQILDNIIDKTQNCIFCQFPITENDISFSLLCKHRSCYMCIYNKLQDITQGGESQLLLCDCNAVIYIYLIAKNIEFETLDLYAEIVSGIFHMNDIIKSYCPYDLHLNKKIKLSENKLCKKCKNPFCQKCGFTHPVQTCLEYYSEIFKKEMKEKLPKCTECNTEPLEINLECECKLCLNCCKNMIRDFLYKEDPTKDPVCDKHNIIIPRMYVYQVFGGQNFFIKEQTKAIDYLILSPKFVCEICLIEFSVNQSITMDCDHRFCYNCIKYYINTKMVDSSSANKIGCPKCELPISYDTLKNNSDPDIFERYLKFSVMAYLPEDKEEVMKWCINCDFGCTISKDVVDFKCPNCHSEYCPKCNKKHFMSECENLRFIKSANELKAMFFENDEFFINFMRDNIKCPNCGEAIQKVSGCNFLTCVWPRCKGISFCAICNKILTKNQHYSHYKISGPFGGTCNITDGIEDE